MKELTENHWNYTKHAKFYEYRPNYAPKAIDALKEYVDANKSGDFKVVDIGAGTGNLTIMLLERGLETASVEPNDAMREIGIEKTEGANVKWIRATGLETTLEDKCANWVTFGSSFNVMDRDLALKETHRLLKDGGYFSCMWNHRDLDDPIQKQAESIIEEFVPDYTRGTRREDQRPVIEKNKDLFDEIFYMEVDFYYHQTLENYILAWQSVKNKYWDLATTEGVELFEKIITKMRETMPKEFDIKYTTRCWTAKKI
jgi:ubiquinone/menaquinone biosynthesis C-methylase UbiE